MLNSDSFFLFCVIFLCHQGQIYCRYNFDFFIQIDYTPVCFLIVQLCLSAVDTFGAREDGVGV